MRRHSRSLMGYQVHTGAPLRPREPVCSQRGVRSATLAPRIARYLWQTGAALQAATPSRYQAAPRPL